MKTRIITIRETPSIQGNGCCGPIPKVQEIPQTSCCSGSFDVEEPTVTTNGCCS